MVKSRKRKPGETRGRKPLFTNPHQLWLNIEQETYDALKKLASEKDVAVAALVRKAIDEMLDQKISIEITNVSPEIF